MGAPGDLPENELREALLEFNDLVRFQLGQCGGGVACASRDMHPSVPGVALHALSLPRLGTR